MRYLDARIPDFLTPRLPADFTGYPPLAGAGAGARLIVFSGVPGTGKSALADATGRELRPTAENLAEVLAYVAGH